MSDRQDKRRLVDAANEFAAAIKEANPYTPLRFKRSLSAKDLDETFTGGWYIKVATWSGHPALELFLDKFLNDKSRKRFFYFDFFHKDHSTLRALEKNAPIQYRARKQYSDRSLVKNQNDLVLSEPPTDEDIIYPTFERYADEGAYFGMYDRGNHGSPNPLRLDTLRATNFVTAIVSGQLDDEECVKTEGGVRHLWIEQSLRNSKKAMERKRLDGFRCVVCSFHFEERYGQIGHDFAECHHLVPFEENKKKRTTLVKDLRTVCSNCHRMLHTMQGHGEKDIRKLRLMLQTRPSTP